MCTKSFRRSAPGMDAAAVDDVVDQRRGRCFDGSDAECGNDARTGLFQHWLAVGVDLRKSLPNLHRIANLLFQEDACLRIDGVVHFHPPCPQHHAHQPKLPHIDVVNESLFPLPPSAFISAPQSIHPTPNRPGFPLHGNLSYRI